MGTPPEKTVSNITFEFLLKQIYAVHKKEVQILTEQLAAAKAEISKLKQCSVCLHLTAEVLDLKQKVHQLVKNKTGLKSGIRMNLPSLNVKNDQTKQLGLTINNGKESNQQPSGSSSNIGKESLSLANDTNQKSDKQHEPLSQKSIKRLLVLSPPSSKKRFRESFHGNSKGKAESVIVDDVDLVLVPNTPEHNSPQRRYRVRKWLQTMEIPETIAPDFLGDGRIPVDAIENYDDTRVEKEQHLQVEVNDFDETILPFGVTIINSIDDQWHEQAPVPADKKTDDEICLPSDASTYSEDLLAGDKTNPNTSDNVTSCKEAEQEMLVKPMNNVSNVKAHSKNANSSFDKIPKAPERLYKYKEEAVRKKEERNRLPAQVCTNCVAYFGEAGTRQLDLCSRHRATHPAPTTPENYWELDFPDTPICKERGYVNITQKVSLLSRRKRPLKLVDSKN